MKKLYEKNELTFALVWIGVYCVLQSLWKGQGRFRELFGKDRIDITGQKHSVKYGIVFFTKANFE